MKGELKNGLDPRQALTLQYYKDPMSETFGNLCGSARRAGFDEKYSNQLTAIPPRWLTENLKNDVDLVKKAEDNLRYFANIETVDQETGKVNPEMARIKADVTKFVLKTLARQKYTEEKEKSVPNVQINILKYNDEQKKIIGERVQDAIDAVVEQAQGEGQ